MKSSVNVFNNRMEGWQKESANCTRTTVITQLDQYKENKLIKNIKILWY